jgi:hypothetical protein
MHFSDADVQLIIQCVLTRRKAVYPDQCVRANKEEVEAYHFPVELSRSDPFLRKVGNLSPQCAVVLWEGRRRRQMTEMMNDPPRDEGFTVTTRGGFLLVQGPTSFPAFNGC